MSAFFDRFDRHGDGLKGVTTHYCGGCGHGIAHRFLARAVEELGIQDRTVAISPVGCSVFMYYYLDVGNTQAAHGRAPAVALAHKLANPRSVVISYQGDGDLASIGLTEILQVAQLGTPISVVFVNNAVYGMTGGQLAPTTLVGQRTSTSPLGRDRTMGEPLRVAELVAQLDGPVYVERVALFDARQRLRAAAAIRKALQLQVEGVGFSFVEVLAECPTHLRTTPVEAQRWVAERMLPVFPLGVKKDVRPEPRGLSPEPDLDPVTLLATIASAAGAPARVGGDPASLPFGPDLGLKFAGAGGDGAQIAAMLVARAAIDEGLDATHIPSYGPESRGGTSYADVRIARGEVLSPDVPAPHALVALNAPSLSKFAPTVLPRGAVVYDRSVVPAPPSPAAGVRLVGVPCSEIARDLGHPIVKNVVALGALHETIGLFPAASYLTALRNAVGRKSRALLAVNEEAFLRGARAAATG